MLYRLAEESDIDNVCRLVQTAINNMEKQGIFQWDELYPTKEDFLNDIGNRQLFLGLSDNDIAVIYVINKVCDERYLNGKWDYPDSEYRVIHRLCVNPDYQRQGIASRTLSYIEKGLKESGIEAVRLDVFGDNPAAMALYLGKGYKNVGPAKWRKGTIYLMEKLL